MEYLARTLIAPILDRRISSLEVKGTAEDQWSNAIQSELRGTVFEAGCSNWYINQHGRNAASWPGYASTYWKMALMPQSGVFHTTRQSRLWMFNMLWRWARTTKRETCAMLGIVFIAGLAWRRGYGAKEVFSRTWRSFVSVLQSYMG